MEKPIWKSEKAPNSAEWSLKHNLPLWRWRRYFQHDWIMVYFFQFTNDEGILSGVSVLGLGEMLEDAPAREWCLFSWWQVNRRQYVLSFTSRSSLSRRSGLITTTQRSIKHTLKNKIKRWGSRNPGWPRTHSWPSYLSVPSTEMAHVPLCPRNILKCMNFSADLSPQNASAITK